MRNTNLKAIACKISRGGFSDERVFSFKVADEEYSGVASRGHMWDANGKPIEDGEPPLGDIMDGYVAVRVLEARADATALVSVPDGGVVEMPLNQLEDRPSGVGQRNVPIGS